MLLVLAASFQNPAAATDLISFLKPLPDCGMRRGVRFPQWWMLLVAILAILAARHRRTGGRKPASVQLLAQGARTA